MSKFWSIVFHACGQEPLLLVIFVSNMNESTQEQSFTLMQKLRLKWTRFWTKNAIASSQDTQQVSKLNRFVGSQWGIWARKGSAKLSGACLRFPPTYIMPAVSITRFVKSRPSSLTAFIVTPLNQAIQELVDDEGALNAEDDEEEFSRASSRSSSIADALPRRSSSSRNGSVANMARAPSQSETGGRLRSSSVSRRSRAHSNVGIAPVVDASPSQSSSDCDCCKLGLFSCLHPQSKRLVLAGDFQDKKSYELPHHIRNYKSKLAKRLKEQVRVFILLVFLLYCVFTLKGSSGIGLFCCFA